MIVLITESPIPWATQNYPSRNSNLLPSADLIQTQQAPQSYTNPSISEQSELDQENTHRLSDT